MEEKRKSLVGRYFKALCDEPNGASGYEKGNYIKIDLDYLTGSVRCDNGWVFGQCSYDWKFSEVELMPEGFEPTKIEEELEVPKHYDNSKGTLYKVAEERGWNTYLFDIVKRLERANKKGEFESDLNKSKLVIDLWLQENKK